MYWIPKNGDKQRDKTKENVPLLPREIGKKKRTGEKKNHSNKQIGEIKCIYIYVCMYMGPELEID